MQLLKQIWNERRSNGWLWMELFIVFIVLWYVVDLTYVTARTYYEPVGFDITDTYYLELSLKNKKSDSYVPADKKQTTTGQDLMELMNRLKRLSEVEAVSISNNARPYIGSNSGMRFRIDTVGSYALQRLVTPDFFKVFRYQSVDDGGYASLVKALVNGQCVVSENILPKESKGDRSLLGKKMVDINDSTRVYTIGAVSKKVRYNDFWSNFDDRYVSHVMKESDFATWNSDYYPSSLEVCLRTKAGVGKDFADYLMSLSDKQLNVGNLYILKVHDYADVRADFQQSSVNEVKMRFYIIGFLLLNILLGIIGTFWFRTQHRRSELGLRIAVGSTRRKIWTRLNVEGLLLLSLATLPAAIVCFNIGYYELTEGDMNWAIGRYLIGIGTTYFLMAMMILVGVWFPARQAMKIEPSEALHEE